MNRLFPGYSTPCSSSLGVRFFICWAYWFFLIGLVFLRCLTVISSPTLESFFLHVRLGLCWPLVRWLLLLPESWPVYLWCLPCSCSGGYLSWPLRQPLSAAAGKLQTVAEMSPECQLKPHKAVFPKNCDLSILLGLHVCLILYLGVIHLFKAHWASLFWFHSVALHLLGFKDIYFISLGDVLEWEWEI